LTGRSNRNRSITSTSATAFIRRKSNASNSGSSLFSSRHPMKSNQDPTAVDDTISNGEFVSKKVTGNWDDYWNSEIILFNNTWFHDKLPEKWNDPFNPFHAPFPILYPFYFNSNCIMNQRCITKSNDYALDQLASPVNQKKQ
jgi:hypothetical protein